MKYELKHRARELEQADTSSGEPEDGAGGGGGIWLPKNKLFPNEK